MPTPLSSPWAVLLGGLLGILFWARGGEASVGTDRGRWPIGIDTVGVLGAQDPDGAVGQVVRALERSPFPRRVDSEAAPNPYGREEPVRVPVPEMPGRPRVAEDPAPSAAAGLLERGANLPRAVLFDAWGNEVALGDLRGRVVVLAFPCGSPRDAAVFSEIAAGCVERYGERRFLWVTVHRGLAPQKLVSFLESRTGSLELHVLEGSAGMSAGVSAGMSVGGLGGLDETHSIHGMLDVQGPVVHWIDAEGRWRGSISDPRELERSLGSWIDAAEEPLHGVGPTPPALLGETEGGER